MKIEICEQMVQAWLQHIKQCEITQTNWKVSPLRLDGISDAEIDEVDKFMKEVQASLNENLDDESKTALQELLDEDLDIDKKKKSTKTKKLNIFKNSTPKQFIRQCEIDVVGCKLDDGITERLYLIDTAFHRTGLGYHDAVATVAKKIVRALLVAVLVFGESAPIMIGFVSPKCSVAIESEIEKTVRGIRTILGKLSRYSNIEIEVYFNEKFTNDIYLPLLDKIDELNDDNDLFMRAMNLAKLAEQNRTSTGVLPSIVSTVPATTERTPRGQNETTVFDILNSVIDKGKMTSTLLSYLQTCAYTREKFNLPTFPMLVSEANFLKIGYDPCRYYRKTININGTIYRVCSQWIPERIYRLEEWYKTL